MKKYKKKDWLQEQIVEKEKTFKCISKECDVGPSAISHWARKFNIKKPTKEKKYHNKEWLKKQLKDKDKSFADVGRECDVYGSTIRRWAGKYGIGMESQMITGVCEECGKEFEQHKKDFNREGHGRFCSLSCSTRYSERKIEEEKRQKAKDNPVEWSREIAYLTGLIASDGSLRQERPDIQFASTDKGLVKQVAEIADNNFDTGEVTIRSYAPDVDSEYNIKRIWKYAFTSRRFYFFLENIGITPNKSLTIGSLEVPDNMFFDWLRGEIDGDGNVQNRQKRGPSIRIASGSPKFLSWINNTLHKYDGVNGNSNVNNHGEAYILGFYGSDAKFIAQKMYDNTQYYLERKYDIASEFL